MPTPKRSMTKSGIAWLVLIATPPAIILGGVITVFTWQAWNGNVTPKWRKARPTAEVGAVGGTNPVSGALTNTNTNTNTSAGGTPPR